MKRFVTLLFIVYLSLPLGASSAAGIKYELTFAGYRFGMSFDQANNIQPFQYFRFFSINNQVVGFVENLMVDETMMDLSVSFKDDRACKILSKFNPIKVTSLVSKYEEILGPPKVINNYYVDKYDEQVHQIIYRWSFPDAEINIASYSSNSDFAVLSLIEKTGTIK